MRHRYSGRKLGRTASHRSALLRTLATSLFKHKKIKTTEAKAKETRMFAEAIITRAKLAYLSELEGGPKDTHARRMIAKDVNDPEVVKTLMNDIAPKVANRNGGYTRVVKLGTRLGDAARIAIIELVDYNSERDEKSASNKSKSTISRSERVARSKKVAASKSTKSSENSDNKTESITEDTSEDNNS